MLISFSILLLSIMLIFIFQTYWCNTKYTWRESAWRRHFRRSINKADAIIGFKKRNNHELVYLRNKENFNKHHESKH